MKAVIAALVLLALSPLAAHAQVTEGDDAPLRFGRFEAEGQVRYGFLSVGGVHELDRSYFDPAAQPTGKIFPLETVKILPPVVPGKIIGVEPDKSGAPVVFAKLPSSIVGDQGAVIVPKDQKIEAEPEMAIVIARQAKDVPEADAASYIAGVTGALDVAIAGAVAPPRLDATGRDTFAPMGPWIVPGLYYDRLRLTVTVNGKPAPQGSTGKMIEPVAKLVSRLSRLFTLEPGDVILAGTSGRPLALKAGDAVEVSLEGVGALRVTVKDPP